MKFGKRVKPEQNDSTSITPVSGHLKARKKLRWIHALPIIAVVVLVGAYLIYRSFATSYISCPGNSPTSEAIETCLTSSNESRITRLYYAAYNRTPDRAGLNYWVGEIHNGRSLASIARAFVNTPEFRAIYGNNPTDYQKYIATLYPNVLGRPPDAADTSYWVNELSSGRKTREAVLIGFSESPEMKRNFKTQVALAVGINMSRVGNIQKRYNTPGNEMKCYGAITTVVDQAGNSRRSCTLDLKNTSEINYIIGGAGWDFTLPNGFTGKSVSICYDVQSGPTSEALGGTSRITTNAAVGHGSIQAQPTGKITTSIGEQPLVWAAGIVARFKTVCHDVTDLAANAVGWYIQVGYDPDTPGGHASGKLAVAMDSVHVYTIDENHASARNQKSGLLTTLPTQDNRVSSGRVAAFPKPFDTNTAIYWTQGQYVASYIAKAEDPQPVWRSNHKLDSGIQKTISPIRYSAVNGSLQIEYIVRDQAGRRIPIDRFVRIDPATGREVEALPTEIGNPSKVSLSSRSAADPTKSLDITPIFRAVGDTENVFIEIRVYAGSINLREGVSVQRYALNGPAATPPEPKEKLDLVFINEGLAPYVFNNKVADLKKHLEEVVFDDPSFYDPIVVKSVHYLNQPGKLCRKAEYFEAICSVRVADSFLTQQGIEADKVVIINDSGVTLTPVIGGRYASMAEDLDLGSMVHEFGHLMGLVDEHYTNNTNNPSQPTQDQLHRQCIVRVNNAAMPADWRSTNGVWSGEWSSLAGVEWVRGCDIEDGIYSKQNAFRPSGDSVMNKPHSNANGAPKPFNSISLEVMAENIEQFIIFDDNAN